ncbi:MAG: hypothetical protein PHG85_00560 [Candidatus Altiarchaeota archaeon]|nr:hypothetical protein [Candidatus Altiarchaeota archaeon]
MTKINRWTGWLSLAYMIVFIATGFAMVGMWDFDKIISVRRAGMLHSSPYMIYPMLVVVIVHSLTCIQRWLSGWTKRR